MKTESKVMKKLAQEEELVLEDQKKSKGDNNSYATEPKAKSDISK